VVAVVPVEGAGTGLPNNPAGGVGANPKLLGAGAGVAPNKPPVDGAGAPNAEGAGVPPKPGKRAVQT